jgi:hypothetical protein
LPVPTALPIGVLSLARATVSAMTSAARHDADHHQANRADDRSGGVDFDPLARDSLTPIPSFGEVEMPFEQAPALVELAALADDRQVVYLTRGQDASALVVMTEDDLVEALFNAAVLAQSHAALAAHDRHPEDALSLDSPEGRAFLARFKRPA